jgi:lysine-specific permease
MTESVQGDLKRGLKVRHVNMIAIGGAIGTGLFLAVGGSLSQAGPGGALVAYGVIGIMVYFLMTSLGEMSTYMPITGSFETYATKFVHPSLGFALGWNYWYNWTVTVAAEVAATPIMVFSLKEVLAPEAVWSAPLDNPVFWSLLGVVLLFALNYFAVAVYGEAEFWFAGIKVVVIIVFLVLGVLMIFGIMKSDLSQYSSLMPFANWTKGDAPFPGGFTGIIGIFMIAGFSFQGTELIGVASGEVKDPEKAIPKAIRTVFFRIMLFYIGAIIVIGFLLPYDNSHLLNAGDVATSPFTLIFQNAGIALAAAIMTAVILTSILSCGNSGMFASTRMLYSLSVEGKAPKVFQKVTKRGVPLLALVATTVIATCLYALSFLGAGHGQEGELYLHLVDNSGTAGFLAWLGIAISHYKFRQAFLAQGHSLDELQYKAKLYPFGPIFAFILCAIVLGGQIWGFDLTLSNIFWVYSVPIFVLILFLGHRGVKKTHWLKPEEGDLSQGFAVERKVIGA